VFNGVSERRPNLVLHVRAPGEKVPPTATITGNRAALEALRELVDAALSGEGGNASRVFREADGADFQLEVRLARSREEMGDPAGLGT
jgi:hypothetical protein